MGTAESPAIYRLVSRDETLGITGALQLLEKESLPSPGHLGSCATLPLHFPGRSAPLKPGIMEEIPRMDGCSHESRSLYGAEAPSPPRGAVLSVCSDI